MASTRQRTLFLMSMALPIAVLRFYLQGMLEPLGVPVWLGSLLASLWVLLLVAVWWLFGGEGRNPAGRYWRAAAGYVLLAAWCEALVIAGILATEKTGRATYYEGPWQAVHERFPTAGAHALGHLTGFGPRAVIGIALGAVIYLLTKRRRAG